MQRFARWHIWLGWAAGVPLLLWTASGLFMAARPIDDVRGSALRIERPKETLPHGFAPALPFLAPGQPGVMRYGVEMRRGTPTARVDYVDGSSALFDAASGRKLTPLGAREAKAVVTDGITAAAPRAIAAATLFESSDVPLDFRRPMPVWQIALEDGTRVYVGRDTGEIEAVRTRWWRIYDFMWGLHIMDLQTRENTSNVFLWLFGTLALLSSLLGTTLLLRRRRQRAR